MGPGDIVAQLTTRFDGLAPKASWGETSLFYNPNLALTNGVYFCTVKEHDGANDKASRLDRPGVFRLALGLTVQRYEQLFGPRPARPPKSSAVVTGHDFTRLDIVMPHPVYAWMGWVQVLNPSEDTFASMQPLFVESFDHVAGKFEKALARHQRHSQQPFSSAEVSKPRHGVPPFGHTTQLRVFVDPDLLQYDEAWAASGTWNDVFPIEPNDLARASDAVVVELKR